VGEDIYLIPERAAVNWAVLDFLRQTPPAERRIVLYGFPPGYGAWEQLLC